MRVLMTSQGASSHFFPLVPLAKALAAAGHEVTFGVPSNLGELVAGLGFQSVDVGPVLWNGPIGAG